MDRKLFIVLAVLIGCAVVPNRAFPASSFYEGKTIRLIVGHPAGGGFDAYARTVARHIGKYIPGQPSVIVDNMPGAGSLIAAKHLNKVAKPDGLTIAHFSGTLFLNHVLGQAVIDFDPQKFSYLGVASKEYDVIVLNKASGINSVEKWRNAQTPIKIGGTAPGADSMGNVIRILKTISGLPVRLVEGYKGTPEIRLAVESGELDGACPMWDSVKATWHRRLEAGDVVVVIQASPKPLPGLPNVPLLINFAKTDEARQLVEAGVHSVSIFARPFLLPPGTPREQVQILRKAFQETMTDAGFLAEAGKANLGIDPVSGEELEKTMVGLFNQSPALLARMKDILYK